ncbi:bifunctional adenosylcobinamide kinase/adenosylcobinamide-phosphate guanylyltransferase [Nocardioides daphniae]|uniref:Adenosylcobinamide kinase n=1 Tax=Nocardioides daphniae TaxID=402297 RepID=A0A4P7UBG4_9ACTN|nr:bifunctional adenosylcobinamide kinase/adenosylcobinamide-phosphate guanylyltransferase [Nocardioides daphniae]QCC77450.1 bifunctional adenosylcobinamide kinase/adenosylcobinamide-phosphate guanylyltransferase [Nocardioides daphniae]GGD31975.1 cobalamin biosynthesis protein CobU [Nocardioides daphniae]
MVARAVLVTGGVRSGKSRHAEELLADAGHVTYVAPGPTPDVEQDPDWTARIEAHRARRPAHWATVEGHDLAAALAQAPSAVLVDCLGTWLTSTIDVAQAWEAPSDDVQALVEQALEGVVEAVRSHPGPVVLVTNEVGLGVVPVHRSGRLFRDLLGTVNQRVGQVCDEVHLVVAGRVLVL